MLKLLIADDHIIIRTALKFIIKNFMPYTKIDEAHDGDSSFMKIKKNKYELLILDVNMPNTDSFSLVSNILALQPDMKILMFSMSDESAYARRFLKVGAKGYIEKGEDPEEIRKAITTVLSNKKYISPGQSKQKKKAPSETPRNPFDNLSRREFEIAQYLVRGESISLICQKTKLHSSTVGTLKARIFKKLHTSNVIELNVLAKVHNLIPRV